MRKYVLKRILMMLVLVIGMTFIVFASLYIAPGDPAELVAGVGATEEDIERVRESLGLNESFFTQYITYLKKLLKLDLGTSFTTKQPILGEILVRLPNTLNLACAAMILSIIVGIPAGIISALKKDKLVDNVLTTGAMVGISIPNFWLGTMLIYVFAVVLKLLPSGGCSFDFHHRKFHPNRQKRNARRSPVRLFKNRKIQRS